MIGEKLSKERMQQGLTVEEIASVTGMSARQVSAIETSAEQWVSAAEMSRMIRLYARKLGVLVDSDPARLVSSKRDLKVKTLPPIPRFLLKYEESRLD